MKPTILIPCFDHGDALGDVVAALAGFRLPAVVVDDGSGPATRAALERLAEKHPWLEVVRRPRNGGKGAALKTGYRHAWARGFSHALQLDADGQHDPGDLPRFLAAVRARPEALVLGVPRFDHSVPRARLYARQLSRGLVWLACLSRAVPDPLCGYRGIPLAPTVALLDRVRTGDHMDFDPELAVRLVWAGVPVEPLPTGVTYPPGGLSHFSLARDYPRLAWLYTRLVARGLARGLRSRRAEPADGRA